MKSSNNLIRAKNNQVNVEPLDLVEFEEKDLVSKEFIQANALSFFGLTKEKLIDKKQYLYKTGEINLELHRWNPDDFAVKENEDTNVSLNWTPFIEQPNPKKMAEQIIQGAQNQADEIIKEAEIQVEKIQKDAFEQGLENAKNEIKETLQAATNVINVTREWRSDVMKQAEPMIMDLVKKMAQKMFGEGLVLENAILQQHFSEVLESTRSLGNLRLFMNPADAKELGPDWREYQASIIGNEVEIITNDSIRRGGCYIQGEWGTADALVETQLNAILEQFSEIETPEEGDD